MSIKIPGLAHEVRLNISSGVHSLELLLRGTIIVSTPIKSRSESGIRKALDELVSKAEIAHQVQTSILDNLAQRIFKDSGYLDALSQKISGDIDFSVPDEVIAKIDNIFEYVKKIDQRLANLEEKLK